MDAHAQENSYFLLIFLFVVAFLLGIYFLSNFLNNTNIHYVSNQRQQMDVVNVHNPFKFDVDLSGASIQGVKCEYSSSDDCQIILLWGMSVFDFLEFFKQSLDEMNHIINSSSSMTFPECGYMERILVKANEKKSAIFRPPVDFEERRVSVQMHTGSPRHSLIALMLLLSDSDLPAKSMIGMASCMLLRDHGRNSAPCLLRTFLKPRSGGIGLLRKAYSSAAETVNENGERSLLCTICYDKPVSMVILPCSHACVCNTCIHLSETCPVCRKRVVSYFELTS